jgi:hypothetical protein
MLKFGSQWRWERRDASGLVIARSDWRDNQLVVDGITMLFQSFFQNVQPTGNFSIGLATNAIGSLDASANLAVMAEPSGNGYARQPLVRSAGAIPTIAVVNSTTRRIEGTPVTFSASGAGITGITYAFAVISDSTSTPKLACFAPIGATLAIIAGTTLDVYMRAQIAGV